MKLLQITIKNYKSIKSAEFGIKSIDGGHTYTLIGVNESGKSSFLKAIALIDDDTEQVDFPKDFFDNNSEEISITLLYRLELNDEKSLQKDLAAKGFDSKMIARIKIKEVAIVATFQPTAEPSRVINDKIKFEKKLLGDYTLKEGKPIKKADSNEADLDLEKYFESEFPKYFWKKSHRIIFWKSDSRHLINDEIDLVAFAAEPENISIPLLNCFELADIGVADIPAQIEKIKTDNAEVNNLQDRLADKVTAHLKKVWPKHPVKIKFQINSMKLSFLVEDDNVKYRAKTTAQRSDGFRQFISFLLTVSAESRTEQLSNSLLLLDEPETHLHPQAQEFLKDELIKITKNDENNIVFFATHSNYMIDKNHLERCSRVVKQSNKRTELKDIDLTKSSYSEVNYEVFDIPSNDYHNELYGFIEERDRTKLVAMNKSKKWFNEKKNQAEDVSLSIYIRHSIHHPENKRNKPFTMDELVESIIELRKIKSQIK